MVEKCRKHRSRTCRECVGHESRASRAQSLLDLVRNLVKADCGHLVNKRDTRRFRGSVICKDCHAFAR